MNKTLLAICAALAASALPTLSHAEDANPLSFNVSLTTDYRYRGISQSRLKPALQGGADYAAANGFYIGTWASTIKWLKDGGASGDGYEWDIYGGYKGELAKDVGYDVGVLQYIYPGNKAKDLTGSNANTTEIYGAVTFGPVTAKYSHSLTSLFGTGDLASGTKSKGSGYFELAASFDVGAGVTVTPHLGYQHVAHFSAASYTDYSVTAAKDMAGFSWSAALVGTDTKNVPGNPNGYAYYSPSGKNLGRTALVLAVKKTF